jgi:glycopeptide antibiotics resistance protein
LFLLGWLEPVFRSYPGFLPGLVVGLAVTALLAGRTARALRIRGALAAALLLSLGVVLAATLFPSPEAIQRVLGAAAEPPQARAGTCNLSSFGLIQFDEFFEIGERTANELLFVPLGICIVLLPRRIRWAAVLTGLALPLAIEAVQSMTPSLDRACEGRDVADNLTGLVAGYAVGLVLAVSVRVHTRRSRRGS